MEVDPGQQQAGDALLATADHRRRAGALLNVVTKQEAGLALTARLVLATRTRRKQHNQPWVGAICAYTFGSTGYDAAWYRFPDGGMWQTTTTSSPTKGSANTMNTGYKSPSAQAADSGGDGNGFQTNPANAFSDNASFAVDTNSGTSTSTSCTDAGKDRHRFYTYGFALPTGAIATGIQVQLQAKVDSTSGSPKMCVELSWDGGATWTTAKTTATLARTEKTYTLGSSTDTWGRTWATDDLTDANFRVRVVDVASNTSRDFSLDWIAVRVNYR